MLTHDDWHDFTLSVLKCKEVRKIYGDHPYGLKLHYIISSYHFILYNIPIDKKLFSITDLYLYIYLLQYLTNKFTRIC